MGIIAVNVLKWDKFNPRADRGNFAWFRFQNGFFSDQSIFGLPNEAKLLFVFLCCEASKHNSGEIALNTDYIGALLKLTDKQINEYLSLICSNGLVARLKDSSSALEDFSAQTEKRVLVANGTDGTERNGTNVTGGEVSADAKTLAVTADRHLDELFQTRGVLLRQWDAWLAAFPDEAWVRQEIKKAAAWECSSPTNKKKRFAAFITRWLTRGWDTRPRSDQRPPAVLPVGQSPAPCGQCSNGVIRARNRSNGASEWCACSCAAGRAKSSYVRFDESRFERLGAA